MICIKKYIEAIIYMEMSALVFKYIHYIYVCIYYTHTHTHTHTYTYNTYLSSA